MKLWQGLLLWVGIIVLVSWQKFFWIIFLVVLGTAIWAAIDSSRIGFHRYKSKFAVKPFVLFIALLLLWPIVFPGYLYERYRIEKNLVQLKDKHKDEIEQELKEREERESMEKTWKPIVVGILTILLGAVALIVGIFFVLLFGSGSPLYTPSMEPIGFIFIITGIVAIMGGILALQRKSWGLALTGSIKGVKSFWVKLAAWPIWVKLAGSIVTLSLISVVGASLSDYEVQGGFHMVWFVAAFLWVLGIVAAIIVRILGNKQIALRMALGLLIGLVSLAASCAANLATYRGDPYPFG